MRPWTRTIIAAAKIGRKSFILKAIRGLFRGVLFRAIYRKNRPPEVRLRFDREPNLPNFNEFFSDIWHDELKFVPPVAQYAQAFERAVKKNGCRSWGEVYEAHNAEYKVLGWADLIQNGIAYKNDCLLFQMDSVWENRNDVFPNGEYELCLGDVGRFYYYIDDDLKARRFVRTRCEFQCY